MIHGDSIGEGVAKPQNAMVVAHRDDLDPVWNHRVFDPVGLG